MRKMITLYPSNWFYNAGVVGFAFSLEEVEKLCIRKKALPLSGEFTIPKRYFKKLNVKIRYFGEHRIASIVGKNPLYRNYLQPGQEKLFQKFVKSLRLAKISNGCDICGRGWSLGPKSVTRLNKKDPGKSKFLERIANLNIVHNSSLGPSVNEFPNAFWMLRQSPAVCHLCAFLVIHSHLALTRLSDGSEIFINAPSFRVMYYLNQFAREVLGASSSKESLTKREILAISIMEYATRIHTTLGHWTKMNIELVSLKRQYDPKRKKMVVKVEFFSLPYEVIQLLSDRRVTMLLNQIGEFAILNLILAQDFSRLMELAYRLLHIGLKPYGKWGEAEKEFLDLHLSLDKNKTNPAKTAQKIFEIFALAESKNRENNPYEHFAIS